MSDASMMMPRTEWAVRTALTLAGSMQLRPGRYGGSQTLLNTRKRACRIAEGLFSTYEMGLQPVSLMMKMIKVETKVTKPTAYVMPRYGSGKQVRTRGEATPSPRKGQTHGL